MLSKVIPIVYDTLRDHVAEKYSGQYCRTFQGRVIDETSRNRHVRDKFKTSFGNWTLTNKQKRAGETNNYRRIVRSNKPDFTGLTIPQIVKRIQESLADVQIPRVVCDIQLNVLATLVVSVHNAHMLPSTMLVCSCVEHNFIHALHTEIDSMDYTLNPNILSHSNVFRRSAPIVNTSMDNRLNDISVVSYSCFWIQLLNGALYHNKVVVIFYDVENFDNFKEIIDGAAFISSHVIFIEPKEINNNRDLRYGVSTIFKGKERDMSND